MDNIQLEILTTFVYMEKYIHIDISHIPPDITSLYQKCGDGYQLTSTRDNYSRRKKQLSASHIRDFKINDGKLLLLCNNNWIIASNSFYGLYKIINKKRNLLNGLNVIFDDKYSGINVISENGKRVIALVPLDSPCIKIPEKKKVIINKKSTTSSWNFVDPAGSRPSSAWNFKTDPIIETAVISYDINIKKSLMEEKICNVLNAVQEVNDHTSKIFKINKTENRILFENDPLKCESNKFLVDMLSKNNYMNCIYTDTEKFNTTFHIIQNYNRHDIRELIVLEISQVSFNRMCKILIDIYGFEQIVNKTTFKRDDFTITLINADINTYFLHYFEYLKRNMICDWLNLYNKRSIIYFDIWGQPDNYVIDRLYNIGCDMLFCHTGNGCNSSESDKSIVAYKGYIQSHYRDGLISMKSLYNKINTIHLNSDKKIMERCALSEDGIFLTYVRNDQRKEMQLYGITKDNKNHTLPKDDLMSDFPDGKPLGHVIDAKKYNFNLWIIIGIMIIFEIVIIYINKLSLF